jgi:hypothetical protein
MDEVCKVVETERKYHNIVRFNKEKKEWQEMCDFSCLPIKYF